MVMLLLGPSTNTRQVASDAIRGSIDAYDWIHVFDMHDHDYLPVHPELDPALVDVTAAIADGHGGPICGPGEAVKRTADPSMRVRL